MNSHEQLVALRTAIAFGRKNQLKEALCALLKWLGACKGGVYRFKGDRHPQPTLKTPLSDVSFQKGTKFGGW